MQPNKNQHYHLRIGRMTRLSCLSLVAIPEKGKATITTKAAMTQLSTSESRLSASTTLSNAAATRIKADMTILNIVTTTREMTTTPKVTPAPDAAIAYRNMVIRKVAVTHQAMAVV